MTELGVRTWGNSPNGATVLLTGTYHLDGEVSQRLLRALPAVLVLREGDWDCPLIPLLADEIVKDEPGQEAVLDRLLDLLLIAVLRAWFARPGAEAPRWYRAYGDPVVGRALRLLHHNPAHPWTVAELAAAASVSRASLARRFNELVGEPPMALPHQLAPRPGRRPAPRARRHHRRRGIAGRLRQPVRAQHRFQARPRRQPAPAPGGRLPGLTPARVPTWPGTCLVNSARLPQGKETGHRRLPRRPRAPGHRHRMAGSTGSCCCRLLGAMLQLGWDKADSPAPELGWWERHALAAAAVL